MTLYEIIDTLKKIALTQPNVRTATDGDIYEKMNGNPSVRYGVFHVVQTTHTEDEQFDNYGFNLFMIDRLEDDGANRISAQSTAKQLLSNIIGTFCETFDADHKDIVYQSFTQKFKDNTCGVWASVTMQVIKDYSCAEAYDGVWRPEIVIINNEDITITKNGTYEPSDGFTGFGKIEVALPYPVIKESDTLHLTAGDTGTYRPEAPYSAVEEVKYEVEPNQHKVLNISENGEYVVMPDEYYGGLSHIDVNVNVPDLNGSYDEGYDVGYQKGTDEGVAEYVDNLPTLDITENGVYEQTNKGVNVNVLPKINPLDYNVSLGNSTFTTLPDVFYFPEHIDDTRDYCMEGVFKDCESLNDISFMEHVTDVTGHVYHNNTLQMFFQLFNGCKALKDITPLSNLRLNIVDDRTYNKDTAINIRFDYMFSNAAVEDFTPLNHLFDKLDADDFNYTFSVETSAFASTAIKRFELDWDWSKCTSYYQMLSSTNKVLEYICELDATNVSGYNPLNMLSLFSDYPSLTYFGGFRNQKLSMNDTYFYTRLPNLTRESCLAIVNNLYDFTGNDETPTSKQGKLKVHANFLTALGDDISIATNKGWTITT